jgi:hypothetical protein
MSKNKCSRSTVRSVCLCKYEDKHIQNLKLQVEANCLSIFLNLIYKTRLHKTFNLQSFSIHKQLKCCHTMALRCASHKTHFSFTGATTLRESWLLP